MEITQAQAAAYREHDPREGETAIRQIQALRNFLCEEGKNRPMSEDHPVGSVIRYIEELEATVQDQSETLHSLHPVVDPPVCEYCGGTGSIHVDFEHSQWITCEACRPSP